VNRAMSAHVKIQSAAAIDVLCRLINAFPLIQKIELQTRAVRSNNETDYTSQHNAIIVYSSALNSMSPFTGDCEASPSGL